MDISLIDVIRIAPQVFFLGSASHLIARFALKRTEPGDLALSSLVVFLCLVVMITALLGWVGALDYARHMVFSAMVFLVALIALRRRAAVGSWPLRPCREPREGPTILWFVVPVAVALTATGLAVSLHTAPYDFRDPLTYHLFFPARWIQEGRLFIVPAVFGDLNPAYAPLNAELTYAFWSLATQSDALSRAGSFPFMILGVLAAYALCRSRGFSHTAAALPVVFAILTPNTFNLGMTSMVDVPMSAALLAALYYLDRYRREGVLSNGILFAACFGLAAGTKFVALTFGLLLVVPFAVFWLRKLIRKPTAAIGHALACLVVVLGCGGFWYIRNWIATGNPLFPLDLAPLFAGAYSREAMLVYGNYNVTSFQQIAIVWMGAYGSVVGAGGALLCLFATLLTILRRRLRGFDIYLYLIPWMFCIAHFALIPFNSVSRLLIAAVMPSYLILAHFADSESRSLRWFAGTITTAMLILTATGLGGTILCGKIELPARGLVVKQYWLWTALALAASFGLYLLARVMRLAPMRRIVAVLVPVFLMMFFALPRTPNGQAALVVASRHLRTDWYSRRSLQFVRQIPIPSTIAYAGNNAPYALLGRQWQNRVLYVNVNGALDHVFHDFFAECRTRGRCPPADATMKPTIIWRRPDLRTWLANLERAGADHLFVAVMGQAERRTIPHDSEGYPIERRWADSMPEIFKPVPVGKGAKAYRIDTAALAGWNRADNKH
jgi:4-amino-4-deoxy-L-arabinose transferase-like glycosyltransferase